MLDQEQLFQLTDLGVHDDPTVDRARIHDPIDTDVVILSDVHLGSEACEAQALNDFLRHVNPKVIIINGDLFDSLASLFRLKQSHVDVIQKLLRAARKGTKIIYIPGNHDAFLRIVTFLFPEVPHNIIHMMCQFAQSAEEHTGHNSGFVSQVQKTARLGNVYFVRNIIYKAPDGKRYLVKHGDEHDPPWFNGLINASGSVLRDILVRLGMKQLVVEHESETNRRLPERATAHVDMLNETKDKQRMSDPDWKDEPRVHGAICSHSHKPMRITMPSGTRYLNTGDWVTNKTAILFHPDGRDDLVRWDDDCGVVSVPQPANRDHVVREIPVFGIAAE